MRRSQLPKIDGYHLLGVAGRGQFGRVLCAYHSASRSLVALKELDKFRFPTHKLLRELRFLIGLEHPNIAKCFTLLYADSSRYLVLEYCEAGTLRDLMNFSSLLSGRQRLELVIDLLAGLAHAHRLQIVHCDIKPENVLLKLGAEGWVVKVSDFGIAHLQQELEQHSGSRSGSPAYMAPERFYGRFSHSSDLYAVGIILYELFAQERPFQGSAEELMTAHLNQRPPNLEKLPAPLQSIVLRALAKLPAQRYESAEQMIAELSQVLADDPDLQTVSPPVLSRCPPAEVEFTESIAALSAVPNHGLLVAIANELQTPTKQTVFTAESAIEQLYLASDYLFIKTRQSLIRVGFGNCSGGLSKGLRLYQSSETYSTAIAPDGSWVAIASGKSLEIRSLKHGSVRRLVLPQWVILAIQAIDQHYLVCLVRKLSDGGQRLVFLSRRGQVLGKFSLPLATQQMLCSHTPFRLAMLTATALLLVDLLPYRTLRIPLPFVPMFAMATTWGYAIAGTSVLMLVDLMGQSIGNIQLAEPISAMKSLSPQKLAVAGGGQLYIFNLPELGVDLIF